jgi:hypothetical protein
LSFIDETLEKLIVSIRNVGKLVIQLERKIFLEGIFKFFLLFAPLHRIKSGM